MKKKTPTVVPFSALKNGTTLYDFFMSQIEPDLVTANLKTLDLPYKGETKEEHDDRYAQYQSACLICEIAMRQFLESAQAETQAVAEYMDEVANAEEAAAGAKTLENISKKIQEQ